MSDSCSLSLQGFTRIGVFRVQCRKNMPGRKIRISPDGTKIVVCRSGSTGQIPPSGEPLTSLSYHFVQQDPIEARIYLGETEIRAEIRDTSGQVRVG